MATFKNSDSTGLWLHNKLGDEDLWSGISGICSHLGSKEVIQNVQACFMTLTPTVKLKLLMAFLHIPRRVVLENGQINLNVEENHPALAEALQELRIKLSITDSNALLPLECLYLNPNALIQLVGMQRPLVKHFALKRKPKSAALRAELLLKSSDAAKQQSKSGGTTPFKGRGMTRKTEDLTPLKGIPKATPGFRPTNAARRNTVPLNRNISRMSTGGKERGTKLLDITEQPIGGGPAARRRKKQAEQEALEKARKEKETAATATAAQPTPDYAASLLPPPAGQTRQPAMVESTIAEAAHTAAAPSYVPNLNINVARPQGASAPLFSTTLGTGPSQSFSLSARENLSQQIQQQLQQQQPQYSAPTYTPQQQPHIPQEEVKQPAQPAHPPPYHQAGVPSVPTPTPQASTTPVAPPSAAPKKGLSLTRDQMLAAQEMFRQSNKVTRPEKALILGFMAGSRENPCPQQGDSMTIKLSEETEMVAKTDGSGEEQLMMADTFFQMNYASGEWRRFKRYKPLQ
ncbi:negative elongation factor A-like isoform X1 [Anneissia japonica]|uniref:negative elongation factor A-like isoform X1 n=1 Tax=Anneissia japonica TaxID=1529436 RepID=UPI0014258211|nr:negative elongation factor A-like isoform X1 [Anneissia japonica]